MLRTVAVWSFLIGAWRAPLVHAGPSEPPPVLVALAPAEDARKAVALGPAGEVYAPDGKGAWVRAQPIRIANAIDGAARAGDMVVALARGAVYRLTANGWSALRLTRKGKAVLGGGSRAIAAVGRQLFALDRLDGGEPEKLALAPHPVLAIGAGARALVVATARGLLRHEGVRFVRIPRAPARVDRLVSDRWAVVGHRAVDLRTGKAIAWPAGMKLEIAALGPRESLIGIGSTKAGLELLTVTGTHPRLARAPVPNTKGAIAAGVVVDRAGRAVIALQDGRLAVRDQGRWSELQVSEAPRGPRPGPPPATSR